MKATLKDRVIAESDDIVEGGRLPLFPGRACAELLFWRRREDRSPTAHVRMASSSTTW